MGCDEAPGRNQRGREGASVGGGQGQDSEEDAAGQPALGRGSNGLDRNRTGFVAARPVLAGARLSRIVGIAACLLAALLPSPHALGTRKRGIWGRCSSSWTVLGRLIHMDLGTYQPGGLHLAGGMHIHHSSQQHASLAAKALTTRYGTIGMATSVAAARQHATACGRSSQFPTLQRALALLGPETCRHSAPTFSRGAPH